MHVVEDVGHDDHEMFKRLEKKYGDPCKITDAVLGEIKGLNPIPEGDFKKCIAMVNTVDRY